MAKLIERRPGRRPHKLGERKDNTTAKLEEAVVAYREALKEWTRHRVPFQGPRRRTIWATRLGFWVARPVG
jgi:hypothetical protein